VLCALSFRLDILAIWYSDPVIFFRRKWARFLPENRKRGCALSWRNARVFALFFFLSGCVTKWFVALCVKRAMFYFSSGQRGQILVYLEFILGIYHLPTHRCFAFAIFDLYLFFSLIFSLSLFLSLSLSLCFFSFLLFLFSVLSFWSSSYVDEPRNVIVTATVTHLRSFTRDIILTRCFSTSLFHIREKSDLSKNSCAITFLKPFICPVLFYWNESQASSNNIRCSRKGCTSGWARFGRFTRWLWVK